MKCCDSQNHMMKFFDRDLNDIEEAQLKQHLKTCTKCSEEFVSLKDIFDNIGYEVEIEPPEGFERQVMSRIENETTMYKKNSKESTFVYNILLVAVSFIFVTFFGGMLWDYLRTPINVLQICNLIVDNLREFLSAAISMGKGISIAIVGVTASIYKTYYYAYIILGIILFMSLRIFLRMVRSSNVRTAIDNGGMQ